LRSLPVPLEGVVRRFILLVWSRMAGRGDARSTEAVGAGPARRDSDIHSGIHSSTASPDVGRRLHSFISHPHLLHPICGQDILTAQQSQFALEPRYGHEDPARWLPSHDCSLSVSVRTLFLFRLSHVKSPSGACYGRLLTPITVYMFIPLAPYFVMNGSIRLHHHFRLPIIHLRPHNV